MRKYILTIAFLAAVLTLVSDEAMNMEFRDEWRWEDYLSYSGRNQFAVHDNYIYFPARDSIAIIEITPELELVTVGTLRNMLASNYYSTCVSKDSLLFAVNANQLDIYELSDPLHPVSIAGIHVAENNCALSIVRNYVVATRGGSQTIDFSNPESPYTLRTFSYGGSAECSIPLISEQSFPYALNPYTVWFDWGTSREASDSYIYYVPLQPGLSSMQLSWHPHASGGICFGLQGIVQVGDNVIVTRWWGSNRGPGQGLVTLSPDSSELSLIDISGPTEYHLFPINDTLYMGSYVTDIDVFCFKDSILTKIAKYYPEDDSGYWIDWGLATDSLILVYVSDYYGSTTRLRLYEVDFPLTGIKENRPIPSEYEITAHPNPFNAACQISVPAGFTADIYDIHGRHIQALPNGTSVWNAEGQPSGVYLVRAQRGNEVVEKRVVLVR